MRNATLTAVILRIGSSLDLDAVLLVVAGRVRALNGYAQAVSSAVTRLHRKLGDDARNPRYVPGECGLGYLMLEPDET